MAFASNMNAKVGLIKETTFNTTPATPVLTNQPFDAFSLSASASELPDPRKTGTRELSAVISGNLSYSGNLTGPLSYLNYDTWFESALFNTWNANVLKFGQARQSLSVEVSQLDTTAGKYIAYTGVVANGFTVDSPAGDAYTTVSFDLIAMGMEEDATNSISASPYSPVTMYDGFKSCGGVVKEGGVTIANVQTVNLTLSNNLSPLDVWGYCEPVDLSEGQVDITGTLTLFYEDFYVLSKFLDGAYSSLEFTLQDSAGNGMTFLLPRIKYTSGEAPVESGAGERLISLPFRAVRDDVEATGLKITRFAAAPIPPTPTPSPTQP